MKHRRHVSNEWRDAERAFGSLCFYIREHRHRYNASRKLGRPLDESMLDAAVFELGRLVAIAREGGEL